jgi:uncharacterized membrane protein
MKELLIISTAFSFFVVCPRMAGIVNVIANYTHLSLVKIIFLGVIFSIPLTILMTMIFSKYGISNALIFCVFTDIIASFLMGKINFKSGIETLIIAAFVVAGVKVAAYISKNFL